jgi:hypothetical protein
MLVKKVNELLSKYRKLRDGVTKEKTLALVDKCDKHQLLLMKLLQVGVEAGSISLGELYASVSMHYVLADLFAEHSIPPPVFMKMAREISEVVDIQFDDTTRQAEIIMEEKDNQDKVRKDHETAVDDLLKDLGLN